MRIRLLSTRAARSIFLLTALCVSVSVTQNARSQDRGDPFRGAGNTGNDELSLIKSVEFVDAPVTNIFRMISDMTGWSIVTSEQVTKEPPKINLWIKNMSPGKALDEVARLAGLIVERDGNTLHVMSYDDYTRIYGVKQSVVAIEHADASRLTEVVRTFVDEENAKIVADAESNQIVLLMAEPLLSRMLEVVKSLDVPYEEDTLGSVRLEYLEADDIVQTLQQFLNSTSDGGNRRDTRSGQSQAPVVAAEGDDIVRAGSSWRVQFMVESTLNTILIRGRESDVERTIELIKSLDVNPNMLVRSYGMKNTNAQEVYETIQSILEGQSRSFGRGSGSGSANTTPVTRRVKVGVSEHNNRIIVHGTEADHTFIEGLLDQIDQPLPAGTGGIRVYRVTNSSASEIATVLNQTLEDRQQANGIGGRNSSGPTRLISEGASQVPVGGGGEDATGDIFQAVITPAEDINAVVIRATATEHAEFAELIKELDAPRDQVMLEVTLVSVRTSENFDLGLELSGAAINGQGVESIGLTSFGIGTVDASTGGIRLSDPVPSGLNIALFNASDFSLVLNALQTVGNTRIQSSPSVLVQDNSQATIFQVSEEPIQTNSQGDSTTITGFGGFVEAGTNLVVTPHIGPRDTLRLDYSIQLSSFGERTAQQAEDNLPPPRFQNALQGTARIPSDYTIVLGGLINKRDGDSIDSVPLLSKLPFVGELFKNYSEQDTNETLYVFIRPIILRDPTFADLIQLSDREVRSANLSRQDKLFNDFLPITPSQGDAVSFGGER